MNKQSILIMSLCLMIMSIPVVIANYDDKNIYSLWKSGEFKQELVSYITEQDECDYLGQCLLACNNHLNLLVEEKPYLTRDSITKNLANCVGYCRESYPSTDNSDLRKEMCSKRMWKHEELDSSLETYGVLDDFTIDTKELEEAQYVAFYGEHSYNYRINQLEQRIEALESEVDKLKKPFLSNLEKTREAFNQ